MGSESVNVSTLEDMCELIVDCPHSTPKWTDSGVIVLRNQNIRNGVLDLSTPSFTNVSGYQARIKRAEPRAGDIVITREAPMGEVCIIPEGLTCCLGQRQVLLRPKGNISSEYLYWALQSPFVRHQISWNEGTGTTVSNIRIPVLKAFQIPRWLKSEAVIANQLSSIAKKISLNREINQTLEQMAQALFKSWFVDFDPMIDNALDAGFFDAAQNRQLSELPPSLIARAELRKTVRASDDFQPLSAETRQLFPNAFENSEEPNVGIHGWVPKGWEASSVIDLIQLVGGGTPKTSMDEYWNGDIPWFSVVDAPHESNIYVIDTEKHVTDLGVKNSSTKVLRKGTTIISARGTVGKCALVARPMAMNQSCYGIQGIDGVTDEFIYYLIRHSVSRLQQRSHGSVFSTITRDTFKSLGFAFGSTNLTVLFSDYVTPMFEKVLSNNLENIELEKLRDTLLPKLISGELRLNSPEVAHAKALVDAE